MPVERGMLMLAVSDCSQDFLCRSSNAARTARTVGCAVRFALKMRDRLLVCYQGMRRFFGRCTADYALLSSFGSVWCTHVQKHSWRIQPIVSAITSMQNVGPRAWWG